ncbi:fimbrial protein [Variovorax sp. M-6]|uniref:fimbrial protein n=1 Tax=Variovorax sp. M-6 TaxID=3233041 RepID=UPI003F97884F
MQKTSFIKLAALTIAGVLSQGAFAADGTINFTGEITDSVCSISPASQNKVVPLGKISRNVFTSVGTKAPEANFTIDLLNCSASARGARVSFSAQQDALAGGAIAIANAGQVGVASATGVAVALSDSAGTPIALGSESQLYVLGEGTNSLKFKAAYVSTKAQADVTVGPANASAMFTVHYN